jgi:hypothetical protein
LGASKSAWLASTACLAAAIFAADDWLRIGAWLLIAVLILLLRRSAPVALGMALVVLYLRYSGHGDAHFPAIDWIRPKGMDLWPGLLQTMGMVVVFACGRAALGRNRALIRGAVLLGALLASGWWVFPQHFNLDRIGAESSTGMPMVLDGRIQTRDWRREVLPSTPAVSWTTMMDNELALSGIAHGMQQETHPTGGVLRATLWGVQRALSPLSMLLTLVASGSAVLVVLVLPVSRRFGSLGWVGVQLIGLCLVFPPVVNLGLRVVGWIGGLPEASGQMGLAIVSAAATLVVVFLAGEASRQWSR